jgi:hypothetical protein
LSKRVALGLITLLPLALSVSCVDAHVHQSASACSSTFGTCIIRTVAATNIGNPKDLLEALVVTGDIAGIVEWASGAQRRYPGLTLPLLLEYRYRGISADQALAAFTLAAAAFRTSEPYTDPEWLSVAGASRDDLKLPWVTADILANLGGYDPWERVLHDPPGRNAILHSLVAVAPDDNEGLLRLVADLPSNRLASLETLRRSLMDRFLANQNHTPNQLAHAAALLANVFEDADTAQRLMDSGGSKSEGYDVDGIIVSIAAARLWNGKYDAASAKILVADLIHDGPGIGEWDRRFQALSRAKASGELRQIGDAYLAVARTPSVDARRAVAAYALASDCYRTAGDITLALAAAREGMSFIPQALRDEGDASDMRQRRQMAGKDNGMAIAPAMALFRAGALEEVLKSNFFSGVELLKNWDRPLSQFDPQWIVDDTPKWLDVAISDVVNRHDPVFAGRVHDALLRAPGSSTALQLTILAAAAGRSDQVSEHLDEALAIADLPTDHRSERVFLMLRTAMAWKVAEMLLAGQNR